MKDKIYKVSFDLHVAKIWVEDGLTAKTLQRRIKEELPSRLCSVAYNNEIVVRNINVKTKKKGKNNGL